MTAADTVVDLPRQVKRCPSCGVGFGRDAEFCPFDGIALAMGTWDPTRDPLTDTLIDNRYEVIAPLGEGGMGTVYKVRHTTLDRHFAMKVLRRDLAADAGLAARFHQEARATAAIHHPCVVSINDFGELDDGAPYFVMELLVGETLATRMRARGLLSPSEAGQIARKLADGLSAAHAANVIHRDLKPENVFLVGAAAGKSAIDEVRIVDFGAAKIIGGSKLTRPGVVFGTPYYMSPEQASGQPVDARADVYSLGVLLYEMITGAVPFEADTYMGVLTKHMFASPAKPSERTPSGVQLGEMEEVILRALEKEPSARYPSMVDFANALEVAMSSRPSARPRIEARSGRPLAFPTLSTADRIQQSVTRRVDDERRRKQRTIAYAVISAAATLAMCALAVFVVRDVGPTKTGTSAAALDTAVVGAPAASFVAPVAVPVPVASAAPPATTTTSEATESATASARPAPPPVAGSPPATPARPSPRPVVQAAPPPSAVRSSAPAPHRPSDELPDPWAH